MPRLERVTIEGFKSIECLKDFEIRPLNVLIGANGAGKSCFMDFFALLRALCGFSLPNLPGGGLANYVAAYGGSESLLFRGSGHTGEIRARLESGENVFELTLRPTAEEGLALSELKDAGESGDATGRGRSCGETRAEDLLTGAFARAVSSWHLHHFHETDPVTGPLRTSCDEADVEYLRPDGANLAAFLHSLRRNAPVSYRDIVDAVRLVEPRFADFVFIRPIENRIALAWKQDNSDYVLRPHQISDGILRYVALATALLQPSPPSLMLIDEPELGLHPQALAFLAEMIHSAGQWTQVVLATQSAALLDFFDLRDVVLVGRRGGASVFLRPTPDEYEGWLSDCSPGDLWRRNVLSAGPVL